jgi:hypothetical protein
MNHKQVFSLCLAITCLSPCLSLVSPLLCMYMRLMMHVCGKRERRKMQDASQHVSVTE